MMVVEMKFIFLNLSIATIFYAEMGANTRAAVICGGGWGLRGWMQRELDDVLYKDIVKRSFCRSLPSAETIPF